MAFLKETGLELELELITEQIEIRAGQLDEMQGVNTPQGEVERERLAQEIGEYQIQFEEKTLALQEQVEIQEQEQDQGYGFFND